MVDRETIKATCQKHSCIVLKLTWVKIKLGLNSIPQILYWCLGLDFYLDVHISHINKLNYLDNRRDKRDVCPFFFSGFWFLIFHL